MRTQAIGVVVFILLLSGCSSSPSPMSPAARVEIDSAVDDAVQNALADCLGRAAEQLDDGRSDAATIGMAISPICSAEWSRLVAANGRGLNPAAYNLYLQKAQSREIEIATGMVLKVRALRSQQKSN